MARSLFDPVVAAEKLHPYFVEAREAPAYAAARRLMDEIFSGFTDVDKSFIREFQTAGFSPRLFELSLFAYLQEQNYSLDRTSAAPDFVYRGEKPFAIEVTTTNPAQDNSIPTPTSAKEFELLPTNIPESNKAFVFQIGKALRRKLVKRDSDSKAYWEQGHIKGIPFVIAVAAFHDAHAQIHPLGYVAEYLYGSHDIISYDESGKLTLTPERVDNHLHSGRSIPSGLFRQPEAENLAGVIFTNSHTLSKFNRIGTEMGYGHPDVAMFRIGTVYDPDPDASTPLEFAYMVEPRPPEEREDFAEGLNIFLNPWAKNPLDPQALSGINSNERTDDGRILTTFADTWQPYASKTLSFRGKNAYVYTFVKMCRTTGDLPPYDAKSGPWE